ncbi:nitroreductase/quinone reductase family protein [Kribbella sp. NPDC000426]|uniref:nitroreductase/quinone reductase family protein n=1 Tax=Kribbella sp. NPDC000426 TaxID=3154255 RepID=UPI003321B20A
MLAVESVDVRPMRWTARRPRLESLDAGWVPPLQLSPVTGDPSEARDWLQAFIATGGEGLVVKGASSRYEPGRREWRKVKERRRSHWIAASSGSPLGGTLPRQGPRDCRSDGATEGRPGRRDRSAPVRCHDSSRDSRQPVDWVREHIASYTASDGGHGHMLQGRPTLLMITHGRRSGLSRRTGATYLPTVGGYLVVDSNGGCDDTPAWSLNLAADARARLQVGSGQRDARARFLHGAERAEASRRLVDFAPVRRTPDQHRTGDQRDRPRPHISSHTTADPGGQELHRAL